MMQSRCWQIRSDCAVLAVLIMLLALSVAPTSIQPSVIQALRRALTWREAGAMQWFRSWGVCLGALLAHAMFELDCATIPARTKRPAQWLSEAVATGGLILVVLGPGGQRMHRDGRRMIAPPTGHRLDFVANPAITMARSLSDTFAGKRPADVPGFMLAQVSGALLALWISRWLFQLTPRQTE